MRICSRARSGEESGDGKEIAKDAELYRTQTKAACMWRYLGHAARFVLCVEPTILYWLNLRYPTVKVEPKSYAEIAVEQTAMESSAIVCVIHCSRYIDTGAPIAY